MLSTTEYLADRPPLASDPQLRRPVEQHRFFYEGQRAVTWVRGKPPSTFSLAFNLALDDEESRIECNSYGGGWSDQTGFEVFMEWRWIHDREGFEAEVQEDRARQHEQRRLSALAQRPKRMMLEDSFWPLVGLLDWARIGEDEAVLAPLVSALSKLPKQSIRAFAERLAYCLYCLDTREHAKHIGAESYVNDETYFSGDWFLYTRCAAVANGRAFYAAALASPSAMPKDLEFEALLSAAPVAWELKTEAEFDHEPGCSYETFSNVAGWAIDAAAHSASAEA
ncbi:DUF4240 domain-containing protein [Paucibacter sp. XJ19-41]|uniref:DUF4240 domain-containing protein n=1 Tax=Paucibacter sp. XJ19-41 TaxID=2927824 RepID=UPI00234A9210|nr:DUF4240 domain-containing protein [Paucibacter sp. XJ19-41]MDC6171266.1 DUF4240 domain-containing protein [Paucibacter sp. XJ19-41]